MGLAARIIPTILTKGRTMVKGVAFNSWRSVGLAAQAVRIHNMRGVDELVMLDIGATPEGRGPDLGLVAELAETCFMPLTVGGGIRSVEDARALLRAGADKVSIRTGAILRPELLTECATRFGSQAIVFSLDLPAGTTPDTAAIVAGGAQCMGAGEILLTAMAREGTMQGYDLGLIRAVSKAVDIPVIAHGGCSGYPDMLAALRAGASAVAAGALFQFTDATPLGAARWLASQGIETRSSQ